MMSIKIGFGIFRNEILHTTKRTISFTSLVFVKKGFDYVNTEIPLSLIYNISDFFCRWICKKTFAGTASHVKCCTCKSQ